VREEVRGVTHLDQLVPGLMGTPTEVPLVMDAPPERSPLVTTPKSVDVATGCLTARRQGRTRTGAAMSSGEMNTCIGEPASGHRRDCARTARHAVEVECIVDRSLRPELAHCITHRRYAG
jgi:hypothetical protein